MHYASVGIALVVLVVGLIVYLVSANAKAAEVGRLMFAVGLFVCLARAGVTLLAVP